MFAHSTRLKIFAHSNLKASLLCLFLSVLYSHQSTLLPACYRGSDTVSLLESSSLEPSIYDVETDGMTTDGLVNYIRLKGKKGLIRLYAILRAEDQEGLFTAARYRQNMHKNRCDERKSSWMTELIGPTNFA